MPAQKKATRRRRNVAASAAVLEHPEEGEEVDVPDLPKRVIREIVDGHLVVLDIDWCQETLDWWDDVWASPMAGEYLDADMHGLIRLAVLVDNYWLCPSAKTHAEVRLAQKDFGLTPYDRRRLEWSIEDAEKAKAAGKRRREKDAPEQGSSNPQPDPAADPRQVLADNVVEFPQAQ